MRILFLLAVLLGSLRSAWGQSHLPVLRAHSSLLSIREGRFLYRDVWGVSSKTKPDVFTANPFGGRQRIVFYSDSDSLAFVVKPGRHYDFVVLLNGTDSAYTRLSTRAEGPPTLKPKLVYSSRRPQAVDTLRFRLDKRFGIHLKGSVNGSDSLDFLFDTGAGAVVVSSALLASRVRVKLDGHTTNAGTDGSSQVQTSTGNTLAIGNLTWQHASLLAINYQGVAFDAVLGWVAFENKVVEIDYDQRWLLVRDAVGPAAADYARVELKLLHGIPYVKCALTANGRQTEGWFDLDTGSDGGLLISQQFAAASGLPQGLRRLGAAESRGSAGVVFRQGVYALPTFRLGTYELYQLPLSINETDPPGGVSAENIGSRILKRFNWILDFRNNVAYVRPSRLLYAPVTEAAPR